MMDEHYALLKPDGLDLKEMREYTVDRICSAHIAIIKKKLWRINEREFMFLRRDSIKKSYFDELMKNYCNQTHELIQLELTRVNPAHQAFALHSIRNVVREQYATSILINGIHIPNPKESLIENVYYDMIMKQK